MHIISIVFKGLYHSLTAGVYVSTVNSNHINFFTSGRVFNVNLWHGISLKAMVDNKAIPADRSFLSRVCMPYAYEQYGLFFNHTNDRSAVLAILSI